MGVFVDVGVDEGEQWPKKADGAVEIAALPSEKARAAVARATESLRLGPLVYLLTLTTPLKLAEEICMLDHLSNGRFELGVGRGPSGADTARFEWQRSRIWLV